MTFRHELLHGLHGLRRNPSFTVIALASLSLSIGANTLIFSIFDATLLKPLGYPEADRLVALWTIPAEAPEDVRTSSIATYFAIRKNVETPLRDTLNGQMQDLQLAVLLVGAFAIVAAALAATGVYGAISLAVADRTREIAIRMVVGAAAFQIAKMVLRNVLWFVSLGLAVGLVLAIGLSRALAWALFGIAPTDPSTYALVALAFVVIAVVACLLPALRAVKVNPTVALRAE